jgi:hypothetical protein
LPLSIRGPVNYRRIEAEPPAANDTLPGYCIRCGDDRAHTHVDGIGYVHRKCMTKAERTARNRELDKKNHPDGRRR